MSAASLQHLLTELDRWLQSEQSDPADWLVCGGAALTLQHLIRRATLDIDVLGGWNHRHLQIIPLEHFPDSAMRAIRRVAEAHPELNAFGRPWVNLGAAELVKRGLPPDFEKRLVTQPIGPRLTLHLLGRRDLIALKLYAAADPHGSRQPIHYADLASLHPTPTELTAALQWLSTMPDYDHPMRTELKHLLSSLGHDDLAYYI